MSNSDKPLEFWVQLAKKENYPWASAFRYNVEAYRIRLNRELDAWTKGNPDAETIKQRVTTAPSLKMAVLVGQAYWEMTPEGFEFWDEVYNSLEEGEKKTKQPEDMRVAEVLARAIIENRDWSLAAYKNFLAECERIPDHRHATLVNRKTSIEEARKNPYKAALHNAFAWEWTPQGAEYWVHIVEELTQEFES